MDKECCRIIVSKTDDGICLKISGEGVKAETCCPTADKKDRKDESDCCR